VLHRAEPEFQGGVPGLDDGLSGAEPGLPIDWRTPSHWQAWRHRRAGYSLPPTWAAVGGGRWRECPDLSTRRCTAMRRRPGLAGAGRRGQHHAMKPAARNRRHTATLAWHARQREARSAYEWACGHHFGVGGPLGGVTVHSPPDQVRSVQRPITAPWIDLLRLVPRMPQVRRNGKAGACWCWWAARYELQHRPHGKAAAQVIPGGERPTGGHAGELRGLVPGSSTRQAHPRRVQWLFCVLPPGWSANLASAALGVSTRRIPRCQLSCSKCHVRSRVVEDRDPDAAARRGWSLAPAWSCSSFSSRREEVSCDGLC
jgi:hypothetical protein